MDMSKLKVMSRKKLSEKLREKRDQLIKDVFMITSFRATKDNSIQVEVCQNRLLGGRKRTLLGALNKSDERFGNSTTLLFDWLILQPEDFISVFPEANVSLEELKEISETWSEDAPTGKEANVFLKLQAVTHAMVDGEKLTPIIVVTEKTHSELVNGFFTGDDADEKIANVIDKGNAVMKTGSESDAEYLVHPETGERIYRFTQTQFAEESPKEIIIAGKITESEFKKQQKMNSGARNFGTSKSLESILEDEEEIQ